MAESRKWTNISMGQMLKQWTGPIGIGSGPGNRHCDQSWNIARKSWLKPSPIQVGGVGVEREEGLPWAKLAPRSQGLEWRSSQQWKEVKKKKNELGIRQLEKFKIEKTDNYEHSHCLRCFTQTNFFNFLTTLWGKYWGTASLINLLISSRTGFSMPSSRASSRTRDQITCITSISCMDRWVLTTNATWEAPSASQFLLKAEWWEI